MLLSMTFVLPSIAMELVLLATRALLLPMVSVPFHKLKLQDQQTLVAKHGIGILKDVLNVLLDGLSINKDLVFL